MSAIDDLEAKVARLKAQLNEAQTSLERAIIEAATLKVGDVVVDMADRDRGLMRVVRIGVRYGRRLEVWGVPKKKNGDWSLAERRVWEWRKLEDPCGT